MADEDPELSPETEQEMREALNQGVRNAANDNITELARLTRRYYVNFRAQGFSIKQSTALTMVVFHRLIFSQ